MKRRLLKLGLLLLACGAAGAVLVAMICALFVDVRSAPPKTTWNFALPARKEFVLVVRAVRKTRIGASADSIWTCGYGLASNHKSECLSSTIDAVPTHLVRLCDNGEIEEPIVFESRGWPLQAFECKYQLRGIELGPIQVQPLDGCLVLDPAKRQIVPYDPMWFGLTINTIFYAALVWLLFFAPFKFRRWRRIRRGMCPACAYPVGTSDKCTECGKPVTPRSVESVT